jgi:hypothetical protein
LLNERFLGMVFGMRLLLFFIAAFGLMVWAPGSVYAATIQPVNVLRVPGGGLQPQASVDAAGTTHLIYFKGEPGAGDLFYARRASGTKEFRSPLRVNTEPGSAMAVGTIRGGQLAVGQNTVHVAWNGHAPKGGSYMDAPMLYTRLNDAGTAFERERNLITFAGGLDGGGSITADNRGNVYVFWHVPKPGNTNGEAGRAVYVALSHDNGKTFSKETLTTSEATGACGCCGMKAYADSDGKLFALFRGATDAVNRDEILLAGRAGEELKPVFRHPWKTPACPMSSASFAAAGGTTLAAWESRDNVFLSKITLDGAADPISPAGATRRKHPSICIDSKGEVLLVWTEGTAWGRGGNIAWQRYDRELHPIGEPGRAEGLPAWSLATAIAQPDGTFQIIF